MDKLAKAVLDIAKRREASYDAEKGIYNVTLHDMAYEDEYSFPAYLMLSWWNDALDWAENPQKYVKGTQAYNESIAIGNKEMEEMEEMDEIVT